MKVCYYNWVDFDDEMKRGGGVTVYQKNIIDSSPTSYFISSGVYYTPPFNRVFYRVDGRKARIYNSPVLAPAHLSFGSDEQVNCEALEAVFINLIREYKGFDILHFNNLEGISANLLKKLKTEFPFMKIVISIHNYYPFCSQVNLWYKEKSNCLDYHNGRKCIGCVLPSHTPQAIKKAYFLGDFLKGLGIKEGGRVFNAIWGFAYRLNMILKSLKPNKKSPANLENNKFDLLHLSEKYKVRRDVFVNLINDYVDGVITVSDRVKELCIHFGVSSELCQTMYIGTQHAKYWEDPKWSINRNKTDIFTIAYLGYMRKDKGFPFFIEALREIDKDISSRIKIVVAAKKDDYLFSELVSVSENFYSLEYYDGYNHSNINSILEHVSLGIVPPLWEDNLPQVAVEFHCRRIPILTSSTGGAKELHNSNEKFIFTSGDVLSFKEKLEGLVINDIDINEYISSSRVPVSMKEHISELHEYYKNLV